jgi:hypothetical protein
MSSKIMQIIDIFIGVHGFKGLGFKVAFSSLDYIWNGYLREKHQLRQAKSKIWNQIGNYLGK